MHAHTHTHTHQCILHGLCDRIQPKKKTKKMLPKNKGGKILIKTKMLIAGFLPFSAIYIELY